MINELRGARTLLVGIKVLFVASCSDGPTSSAPTTSSTPSTSSVPAARDADQVCRLLTDDEADDAVPADVVSHRPGAPDDPKGCSWFDRDGEEVVVLGLFSANHVDRAPRSFPIGMPCQTGSTGSDHPSPTGGPSMNATCVVDGLALRLPAETTELAKVMQLLQEAVPRLAAVDRSALGLPPRPHPRAVPTTSTTQRAPQECLDAWDADLTAPIHCEEYPEAYEAFLKETGRS